MIKKLNIKNFKSIKNLSLDCKPINLFIGAPNVGKSNILEALSLFNVPYTIDSNITFKSLIRFNSLKNLFYDNSTNQNIEINTDIAKAFFNFQNNNEFYLLVGKEDLTCPENLQESEKKYKTFSKIKLSGYDSKNIKFSLSKFNKDVSSIGYLRQNFYSSIRKYVYNDNSKINSAYNRYLLPPFGENLITIIQQNPEIYSEIGSFFDDNGLELLYDIEKNNFEIQKKVNKIIYKYPFNLIADTLKRIIFYLTVVSANKETSILLEEPETHSYPPYTKLLAQRISQDKSNQYFITTHSPYLLHNIIENTNFKDLNIVIVYYEKYQTKLKVLTRNEIIDILDNNIEIFYNLDKFIINE